MPEGLSLMQDSLLFRLKGGLSSQQVSLIWDTHREAYSAHTHGTHTGRHTGKDTHLQTGLGRHIYREVYTRMYLGVSIGCIYQGVPRGVSRCV